MEVENDMNDGEPSTEMQVDSGGPHGVVHDTIVDTTAISEDGRIVG
jgi:hypothetical protein